MMNNSLLSLKKENFRKEIRRQKIEEIFQKKRLQIINNSEVVNIKELLYKLQNFIECDQILNQFCDSNNQPFIISELLQMLNNTTSIESILIGLRCLGNQIYYYSDFPQYEQLCYDTLYKLFQNGEFRIKQLALRCVGNFINDHKGFVIQIQNDFFLEKLLESFKEEYAFIINVLSSTCKLDCMIKCVQFLSQIIQISEIDDALEATEQIFQNCTSLEADEIIDSDFLLPFISIIKYSQHKLKAFDVIIQILNKINEYNKVSLYTRGLDCLLKYFFDHPDQKMKEQGFTLMLQFVGRQEENDQQNLLITAIFQLYDDNTLYQLLITDCTPQKLLIICNSIQNGSIQIFIEFLHLNIISKIFIPYLLSQDRDTISIICETIEQLFQRDELCLQQFNYIIKTFNTEQFKQSIEINYYNKSLQSEEIQIFDSILQILSEYN